MADTDESVESAGRISGCATRNRNSGHISGNFEQSTSGIAMEIGVDENDENSLGKEDSTKVQSFLLYEAVSRTCAAILSRHQVHRPLRTKTAPVQISVMRQLVEKVP